MEIYGGRAGFNSVSFTCEKYESLTRFKNRKIMTEIRLKKGNRGITNILLKIPFVRSFSMLMEIVIDYWRRFLLVVIPLFLVEFIFIKESNSTSLYIFPINTLAMLFCFLILAGLVIKLTPIGKYHAAEHMVANAYEKDSDLTLEKVKIQPRTHKDCGTNLVISIFICFFILFILFGDAIWVLLVSWSIGYELWKIEPKFIWNSILVIGKGAQYLLFTTKPSEIHLMVAMEAIKKLEEKEDHGDK